MSSPLAATSVQRRIPFCGVYMHHINAYLGIRELIEGVRPLALLLSSMNVHDRHVHVVQQIAVELDGIATRKEHHHLLVGIELEEGEQ